MNKKDLLEIINNIPDEYEIYFGLVSMPKKELGRVCGVYKDPNKSVIGLLLEGDIDE